MYHGIMGSNFCRNITMENCYVDRFDSHQGVHNATIKNCTLGFGILVIGGGDLYVENVYRISGNAFVHLRMDYNSVFDGDVVLKKCRFGSTLTTAVEGIWIKFFNGLDNRVTNSISLDDVLSESGDLTLYSIYNATPEALDDDTNKLYLPKTATIKNVYSLDGSAVDVKIAKQPEAFTGVKISHI